MVVGRCRDYANTIPCSEEMPDDRFLSFSKCWFLWPKSMLAGVTSIPAFRGENSRIPTPDARISSSDVSSNDIETVGPRSGTLCKRRIRRGWKWWPSCSSSVDGDLKHVNEWHLENIRSVLVVFLIHTRKKFSPAVLLWVYNFYAIWFLLQ